MAASDEGEATMAMAMARHSVVVQRPCEEVFAFLADPRTHARWQPQLLRTEVLTDGPIGVGSRAVEVRRMFRRELRAPFEITRHEPPHRQDFRTTAGPIRPAGVLRCERLSDTSTQVSYEFTLRGWSARPLARMLERGMRGNLVRLKTLLESPPSEPTT